MNDRELHDEELKDFDHQNAWNKELDEIIARFEQKSPEERAYVVIKKYMEGPHADTADYSEEFKATFYNWLVHPKNRRAKNEAMFRVFMESYATTEDKMLPMVLPTTTVVT